MEYENCQIPWNEEQWNKVQETIREEARKMRVAASFLPLYGPLTPETESVPLQNVNTEDTAETGPLFSLADFLEEEARQGTTNLPALLDALGGHVRQAEHAASRRRGESEERLLVDDTRTRPLTRISVNVYLTTAQIHQQNLSSGLILFRRAANLIARIEDRLVFQGQQEDTSPQTLGIQPPIFRVSGGAPFLGLIEEARTVPGGTNEIVFGGRPTGQALVTAVAEGISRLEANGHLGPFALILDSELFVVAYTPNPGSLVLPADRIKPLLDGPLLRSSTIPDNQGVLVSLASDLVDLVVAKDISAKFIQATLEPRYVFRVSERITLRVKHPRAIMAYVP